MFSFHLSIGALAATIAWKCFVTERSSISDARRWDSAAGKILDTSVSEQPNF